MKVKILLLESIVIGTLLIFTGLGFCAGDNDSGQDPWTKAFKAKSTWNTNPGGFAAAMKQGSDLREAKRYYEAIGAFSEAIRLNSQSSDAYSSRGNVRRTQKDFTGAMVDYQVAIRLNPMDTGLKITLANIKTDMGKYADAIADLNGILAVDPNNLDALISRGYARSKNKDYTGAKADLTKALGINPKHSFAARSLQSLEPFTQASVPADTQTPPPLPAASALPSAAELKGDSGRAPQLTPPAASSLASGDGTLRETDPCKPDLKITDFVWSAIETPTVDDQKSVRRDSRFQDLLIFSKTRHNHPVTTAKAQVAYVMGELSSQDQAKFDEKWSFFFQYPIEETTVYFEKLIPLLADLIEKRNQLTSAVLARDEAGRDAADALTNESTEALADARAIQDQQTKILTDLEQELKTLAAEIRALGDPPNPLAKACKERKKHEDAKKAVKDTLKATISPAKLKGKTNIAYTFKPGFPGLTENVKFLWDFGDGEVIAASSGEVKHTFKKTGKFVVALNLINPATQEKITLAEAKALITGQSQNESTSSENAPDAKFNFIAKDPFAVGAIPEGCTVVKNEGSENRPIHANESVKDRLYYTFTTTINCKEKNFTKGEASLEYLVKPVPFRLYATPSSITLLVEYYPPGNIYYKDRVESMAKFLGDERQMKSAQAEVYNFKGWNANGRITGYGTVKNPLSKSSDRIRHEVHFYGLGQERTTVTFGIKTMVGYFEDSFGIDCRKDGRYCGRPLNYQIVDKFREGLNEKLEAIRVRHYNDMEKMVAGIKLKGLPYPYKPLEIATQPPDIDDSWLNDDGTSLTSEEIIQRKKQALQDAEKFYQSNIEILQKNLSAEQTDYEREKDPDRKAAFFFRMMAIKADIQAEQDKINTLHTGQIVHTRTQYDDYMQNKFVERIKTEQGKYVKLQRDAAIIRKEANKLTGAEKDKAIKFIDEKLNGKTLARLDEDTVHKVGAAIFNKTQGYNEAEAAKYEEEAYMWDDYLTRAERVKMAADVGMVGFSFLGGPMAISAVYDISTGYCQGGPQEAANQLLLQAGTFALGKYWGAGSKAAAGADEAAMATRQSGNVKKGLSAAEELKIFKTNRAQGEKVVGEFAQLNQDLKKAYLSKASPNEIAAIKKQIREKTVEIQANPHAKNFLKYNNDKLTQTRFTRSIKSVHAEVEKKFYAKMKDGNLKWGDFKVKEMRNASSAGSVGMDYDIGLIEKQILRDSSGKPQYWLMKDGKPATRKMWQDDARKCWNEAYQEVTLQNAERSWENVTTKIHPESYQDLAVLEGNLSKVSVEWIQQTADVTRYKSLHMLKDGSMSKFEKLQEISRGTAKDINTKLMPLLGNMQKNKQVNEAATHWKNVTAVLDDFGKNKIDPITAERRIAELTGGKSIPEVVDDMSYMMESIVKLGKKS